MIIINDDYDRNNNDLKDGHNHRFEKKETLIWTRNWSGLHTFLKYKHYAKNNLKQRPRGKKIQKMRNITPTMGHYPRNR